MKLLSKNAIFNLRINIIISDDVVVGIASGTAVCLKALPMPMPLKISNNPKYIHTRSE